jgi:hypothetical protein
MIDRWTANDPCTALIDLWTAILNYWTAIDDRPIVGRRMILARR